MGGNDRKSYILQTFSEARSEAANGGIIRKLEAVFGFEPDFGVVFKKAEHTSVAAKPVYACGQVNVVIEGVIGSETAEPTRVFTKVYVREVR